MSELDKFMGKVESKTKKVEVPAELVETVAPSTLEKLLQALVDVQLNKAKTEAEVKAEADIVAKVNAAPNIDMNDRVWIILSANKNITKHGQFFGVNGASFLLKPNQKAYVPRALLSVLNDAVEGMPVVDDDQKVVEYRETLRYPYQITTPPA